MKIVLTLFFCSFTTGECLPPYKYPLQFNDMYDCLNAGYIESQKKTKEIGRAEINAHGIYIRFSCTKNKRRKVET